MRKYDKIEEAIERAVEKCIEEDILADILLVHKSEVTNMLLTEFNEEEYIDMVKAEGIEIGKTEGKKQVILEMISDGVITPEEGAKRLGIAVDELKQNI